MTLNGNSVIRLFCKFLKSQWPTIAIALCFKSAFLLIQVIAIWTILGWMRGSVPEIISMFLGIESASYVYPVFAGLLLIFSSVCSFVSKLIAISAVKRLEFRLFNEISHNPPPASDWRNLAKLLLSLTDSLMPLGIILAIIGFWLYFIPVLMPLVIIAVLIIALFQVRGIRFSKNTFLMPRVRAKPEEYIGSDDYLRFYKLLMVPQYVTFGTYILVAVTIAGVAILIKSHSATVLRLGLLPLATALSILQLKSFIGLTVRWGVYAGSASAIDEAISSNYLNKNDLTKN